MIGLLDANVLIALFDEAHVNHAAAHRWFGRHRGKGWATCPLTQNACVRIIAQPAYPGRLPVADIARRVRKAAASSDHHFWPDSISLCDQNIFDHSQMLTPKHLTDLYLLALAVSRKGRLVTFDQGIRMECIHKASADHMLVL